MIQIIYIAQIVLELVEKFQIGYIFQKIEE